MSSEDTGGLDLFESQLDHVSAIQQSRLCGVGGVESCPVGSDELPGAVGLALGGVSVFVFEQVVMLTGDRPVGGVGESASTVGLEVVDLGEDCSDRASEPHTSRRNGDQRVS